MTNPLMMNPMSPISSHLGIAPKTLVFPAGEHHRAIGCLNKLLQIHHEEGDKDAELAVLGSLASISYETEDYEMAVRHYEEILEKVTKNSRIKIGSSI